MANASGWLWSNRKLLRDLHEHPEYEARSGLTLRKFSDWIEGVCREHPGYRNKACSDANDRIMALLTRFGLHTDEPDRIDEAAAWLHEFYGLYQGWRAKNIVEGRAMKRLSFEGFAYIWWPWPEEIFDA